MISFFEEEVEFKLKEKLKLKKWINSVCVLHKTKAGDINYIFCTDEYLLEINKEYLNHDFYTDIITFDQSESNKKIDAEIYISIDRVKENAETNKVAFTQELNRIIIHGVLHLVGFKDKSDAEAIEMRNLENKMLEMLA
jgi:probable rRNA maturation factor